MWCWYKAEKTRINNYLNLKHMRKFLLSMAIIGLCGVTASAQQDKDPAVYAATEAGEQLTNLYLNSSVLHGGAAIYPGGIAGDARGMAVAGGKMYVCNRGAGGVSQLVELDGVTGALLRTIELPKEMWQEEGTMLGFVANDVQADNAGHIFVANMSTDMRGTGAAHLFRVNYVDVTQNPVTFKTVLNTSLPASLEKAMRIDTYDVYGDILNGNGIIMLPVSGVEPGAGNTVLKYTVTNGVADADNPQTIVLSELNPKSATGAGAAPRINIVDDELFYHDGFTTLPMLYDMNGNVVDGFQNNKPLSPASPGQNGVTEFELNGSYYLIVASTNTNNDPPQAFDLFKFKDDSRSFADMKLLYRFPEAGLGSVANAVRTALPRVEIVEGTGGKKKARINIYAYRNGYGIYEFTNDDPTSVKTLNADGVNFMVNGCKVTVNGPVKTIDIYSVDGQKVASSTDGHTVNVPAKGVYMLAIQKVDGSRKTTKIVTD